MIGTLIVVSMAILIAFATGAAFSAQYWRSVVALLEKRIAELDVERKIYIDQLARSFAGAPIFAQDAVPTNVPDAEEAEEIARQATMSEDEKLSQKLRMFRSSPTKMAQVLSNEMWRKFRNHPREKVPTEQERLAALEDIANVEREAAGQ